MSWFVLAGRNVGFQIGKWPQDFDTQVPVIRDVLMGLQPGQVPNGVTLLAPPPFLNEVGLDIEAGITPVTAIGVENIAGLQEFIVRAQNIRTRFTVQTRASTGTNHPINFIHNIFTGATRLLSLYHLPPYYLEFFVVDPGPPVKSWRICAPFAFIRNFRWTQRPEDAAQLEVTWFVPYISFDQMNNPPAALVQYVPDAGVLTIREGVLTVSGGSGDVVDISLLNTERIVTDLSIEINNDLREVYTFSLAGDITNEAIRKLLRVFNAIFEGRSTITGSFTFIYPAFMGSLNLAQPQTLKRLTFAYYEAAGSGYTPTPQPVYYIRVLDAKILSARVTFALEQMLSFNCSFQALDIEAGLGAPS